MRVQCAKLSCILYAYKNSMSEKTALFMYIYYSTSIIGESEQYNLSSKLFYRIIIYKRT